MHIFLCSCRAACAHVCRTCVCTQCHAGDSGSIVLAGADNNEPLCLHIQGHIALDAEEVADTDGVNEPTLQAMVLRGAPGPEPAAAGRRWNMKGLHKVGECLALGRQLNRLNSQLRDEHTGTTAPPELGLCAATPLRMPHTSHSPISVSVKVFQSLTRPRSGDGTNFVG